jgi:hypothetical protein
LAPDVGEINTFDLDDIHAMQAGWDFTWIVVKSMTPAKGPERVKLRSHGSKMARPVYLQQRTYLLSVATAVECH